MDFMAPYAALHRRCDLCRYQDEKSDRQLQKAASVWTTGLIRRGRLCGRRGFRMCRHASLNNGVHFPRIAGRASGPHGRGTWREQNYGLGHRFIERQLRRLCSMRAPAELPWVLELYCAINANKPACADLGIGHVSVGGQHEKDDDGSPLVPDLLMDLALVFAEHPTPLEFVVESALRRLNAETSRDAPRYTAAGLILIIAAPRCTTYCSMGENNESQGNFHSRTHVDGVHAPKAGGAGVMARADDAANKRMFYFLALWCGLGPGGNVRGGDTVETAEWLKSDQDSDRGDF